MKKIDFHDLDGHNLKTFLALLEESSVSKTAERLGVSQSTVSHTLAKLRAALNDPLLVRSGQGLTPTGRAMDLREPVRELLDGMMSLTDSRAFDPKDEPMHFVIAANDMQRDLIFPAIVRESDALGLNLSLEIKPSGVPSLDLLRESKCDMILTPIPPVGSDLIQRKLFTGYMMCFYDPDVGSPPKTLEAYRNADHVSVQFATGGWAIDVLVAPTLGRPPTPKITVSNFAGLVSFIKGTKMISTQMEHMHTTSLQELAMAPLPFESEPVNLYMVWHQRSQNDPAHRWLREAAIEQSKSIVSKYT